MAYEQSTLHIISIVAIKILFIFVAFFLMAPLGIRVIAWLDERKKKRLRAWQKNLNFGFMYGSDKVSLHLAKGAGKTPKVFEKGAIVYSNNHPIGVAVGDILPEHEAMVLSEDRKFLFDGYKPVRVKYSVKYDLMFIVNQLNNREAYEV
jgi:hypothetical protein